MKKRFDIIGKGRRRVDGRAKVTGQLRFADDLFLPRTLHAKLLRSPHPHAIVEKIDFEKAKNLPGVHLVLTGADFPVPFGIMPVSLDEYPLARERVRYVGDPVAAVIARDEQTATEALDLIEVRYKVLKPIAGPEEALASPEPRIHDYGEQGNIHRNQSYEFGKVDEALGGSALVFEDLFFYEGNTHLPMEQQASLARLDGARLVAAATIFGAIFPTLVAWFVVAPLKGNPAAGGFVPAAMLIGPIVNGAWGLGTGLGLARFGKPRRA